MYLGSKLTLLSYLRRLSYIILIGFYQASEIKVNNTIKLRLLKREVSLKLLYII